MKRNCLAGMLVLTCAMIAVAADDILIADFEGESYGQWKTTGDAFGTGPVLATAAGNRVTGHQGARLVNSYLKGSGDKTTGTLTSPPFTIERNHINLLVGGGDHARETCVNLVVDGETVRTVAGPAAKDGANREILHWVSWDVSGLSGKEARIRIVDSYSGGWGHINVDQIVQSDTPLTQEVQKQVTRERSLGLDKRYLLLPVKTRSQDEPKQLLTVLVDGAPVRRFNIELDDQPGWFAHLDVSEWKGKSATLRIENIPENSKALELVSISDEVWNADKLYSEPLRPQLQFTSRVGWMNDPNGLVFYNGEYHLFFQHAPYSWTGGGPHWGHAISRDLVHWQELGEAIYPDGQGGPWSGSAVVDWNNTSGFGKDGKPPLVIFYTYVGDPATQCIAYSTDGRIFTKFAGNPAVKNISHYNRDPKVFWHEPTQKWVMVLYVGLPNADKPDAKGLMPNHTLHFFTSPNLRDWTLASVTKGGGGTDFFLYECPDFFELPVDGDASNKKWVLSAGNSEYAVGTFDGKKFTPEEVRIPGQSRRGCFYAPQTFNDTPDGRRIQIGWGQAPAPGMPFNQLQTFPCELTLRSTSAGSRLCWQPVKELETLRVKSWTADKSSLAEGDANPLADVHGELLEIRADFTPAADSEVVFNVRGVEIRYNAAKQEISGTDVRAPAPLRNGRQRITIFADRNYFTVFAGDGLTYMPFPVIPKSDSLGVEVKVKGGAIAVQQLETFKLKSIWEK